jgi:hypothetical protein
MLKFFASLKTHERVVNIFLVIILHFFQLNRNEQPLCIRRRAELILDKGTNSTYQ